MGLANAAERFETALVDRGPRHARIEQAADDRRAQPARRHAGFELGDPLLQEFAMQRTLRPLCAAGCVPAGSMPTAAWSVGEP